MLNVPPSRKMGYAAALAAFVLFAAINLLTSLTLPIGLKQRGLLLLGPILSGIVVVAGLPFILTLFEKQADNIERQQREIDTLHAMDTAIVSEMELSRVLDEVVKQTLRALDAEAGGVWLFGLKGPSDAPEAVVLSAPDRSSADVNTFRAHLLSGGKTKTSVCETVCVPIRASGDAGEDTAAASPTLGYLAAARFLPCRPFKPGEAVLLDALGGTTAVAVTNARALLAAKQAERIQADLNREKRVAEALTQALLPPVPERAGQWALSRRYLAQSSEAQVGGDIYDVFRLDESRWGVVIADVSGKGLAAATKTAMVKYCLRSYAREHISPAQVLFRLNDALFDEPDMTGFVTLVYGVFEETSGDFVYASAGHEPLLLRRVSGDFEELMPTGLVCGVMRGADYEDAHVHFAVGDGVLLYTDGLTEARTQTGDFLTTEGAMKMLTHLRDTPASAVADKLLEQVRAFTGGRLSDDTAVVWVERVGETSANSLPPFSGTSSQLTGVK